MNRSLRIAVADDEIVMRNYFRKMLPRMGHDVVGAAENGKELVDLCRSERPDLVITDNRMPDMDGVTAAEHIRQEQTIPIILVSAHHDAESIARAEASNVMAYLVKPIKRSDMESAIALAMQRFQECGG